MFQHHCRLRVSDFNELNKSVLGTLIQIDYVDVCFRDVSLLHVNFCFLFINFAQLDTDFFQSDLNYLVALSYQDTAFTVAYVALDLSLIELGIPFLFFVQIVFHFLLVIVIFIKSLYLILLTHSLLS